MSMGFGNAYDDAARAKSYARLAFPGTYYLAFRDLPDLLARHAAGRSALDFGCGAGRSTRFLRKQGFDAVGIDVSAAMVAQARELDPGGDYGVVRDGDFSPVAHRRFDVVLAAFTFDNVPGAAWRVRLLRQLRGLLAPAGRFLLLGSTPEIYWHEWASFTTREFPENRAAPSGGVVRIVMTDVPDRRPVEDLLWRDGDYQDQFRRAGLDVVEAHRPLGRPGEPVEWVSERTVAPWVVYVLRAATGGSPEAP